MPEIGCPRHCADGRLDLPRSRSFRGAFPRLLLLEASPGLEDVDRARICCLGGRFGCFLVVCYWTWTFPRCASTTMYSGRSPLFLGAFE